MQLQFTVNSGHRYGYRLQRGFAMLELMIAITVSAIIALYANAELSERSKENIARSSGVYLNTIAQAVERHVLMNFNDLANGVDVAGTAVDLRPTMAELIALNRLRAGYPAVSPTQQTVRIDIIRTNCPGVNCLLQSLVCTTTPITMGSADTRFDLAVLMVEEQGGRGGWSQLGSGGANIRGPALNVANPIGNVEGIVCGSGFVDVGMFNAFVRIGDNRDPALTGNFTVAGTTTLNGPANVNNNLAVTGTTTIGGPTTINNNLSVNGNANVGPCINLEGGATGRAGFGCANPNDLPAGWGGGVRTFDMVASGSVLLTRNPGTLNLATSEYALMTTDSATGVAEIRTSGRAAANRLTPLGQYAEGAACVAADEGSIARLSTGPGLVTCTQGAWRVFTIQAGVGTACPTNGATARQATGQTMVCVNNTYQSLEDLFRAGTVNAGCMVPGATAIDTSSNNETLICRINLGGGTARWMRLRDVTTHLVFVRSEEVAPGGTVTKPVCNGAASQSPVGVIQLVPKVWGTTDGGQAFYAVDNGANWTVNMREGSNANLTGTPNAAAIAQIFCYFP